MALESHLHGDESVHARYEGDWRWFCTDRRVLRVPAATAGADPESLSLGEIEDVVRAPGRDTRYLVAALSALLLATLVPPLLLELANVAVAPASSVAAFFAALALFGFYWWSHSSDPYYQFRVTAGADTTTDWRLPDDEDAAAFVETVRLRL